jgi:hypothetical protein
MEQISCTFYGQCNKFRENVQPRFQNFKILNLLLSKALALTCESSANVNKATVTLKLTQSHKWVVPSSAVSSVAQPVCGLRGKSNIFWWVVLRFHLAYKAVSCDMWHRPMRRSNSQTAALLSRTTLALDFQASNLSCITVQQRSQDCNIYMALHTFPDTALLRRGGILFCKYK